MHKSVFYYSNGKFITSYHGFSSVPVGGGNDVTSSTQITYNTGGFSYSDVITYTSTYNKNDMPAETKSFTNGTLIGTVDYTYIEVKK